MSWKFRYRYTTQLLLQVVSSEHTRNQLNTLSTIILLLVSLSCLFVRIDDGAVPTPYETLRKTAGGRMYQNNMLQFTNVTKDCN